LRRIIAVLLLALVGMLGTVTSYARSTPASRASQQQAKHAQKVWNQYVKERNKSQGKPPKQSYKGVKQARGRRR
jgi:Tfp pilus assembly protein PilV